MTMANTVARRAAPDTRSQGPRNPIPGPTEKRLATESAEAAKAARNARYLPPKKDHKYNTSAGNRGPHPLLANPKQRSAETMRITPQVAHAILENWNRRNRRIVEGRLRLYAEDMAAHRWNGDNGEPVTFDVNGDLINGQHRLISMVRTQTALELLVVGGLPVDARETVDIGSSRTLTQILEAHGIGSADTIGRAARLLIVYENGGLTYRHADIVSAQSPTKAQVRAYIDEHSDELQRAARMAVDKLYRNDWIHSPGVLCFLIVLFNRQNPELARQFLYQVQSGQQSPAQPTGLDAAHPAFQLRTQLYKQPRQHPYRTSALIGLFLKTWIALRDGKPTKRFTIREDEKFPDIDEGWPAGE